MTLNCLFSTHSRAAWWLQRPRTKLRRQREQEPGPDLLRSTQRMLLIELHLIRIFSAARRTIFHLFIFFNGINNSLSHFHIERIFICFVLGGRGGRIPVFRISENGRLFYLPLQHLLPVLPSSVIIENINVFCPSF